MKRFKLSVSQRRKCAESKLRNWENVKAYARKYMRAYRAKEPGKTIVREAQARYMKRLRKDGTIQMYVTLRQLAIKDGLFGNNPSRKTKAPGNWKIRRIKG